MAIEISKLAHTAKFLVSVLPGAVVGGSLGLHTRNLLSRLPNDIDIFYPHDQMPYRLKSFEIIEPSSMSPFCTDVFGETIKRRSLLINDVPVCLFTVPQEQCGYDLLYNQLYNVEMRVQYPVYAIEAKKQYYKRYGDLKHHNDLAEIHQSFIRPQSWTTL